MTVLKPANDDQAFEARMNRRYLDEVKRLGTRSYRCIRCGQHYPATWVAYNGMVCDSECDGQLAVAEGM